MTEFEAATIAYQNASLTLTTWQTVLSGLTLVVSSGLVLYGFRLMRLGTEQRREEARQQHQETMAALEQQGQVMTQAFTQQGEALRVLIERTGN